MERLAVLGETDPESVVVLEKELATWLASRGGSSTGISSSNSVTSILAATDALTRSEIVKNLRARNRALANRLAPVSVGRQQRSRPTIEVSHQAAACAKQLARANLEIQRGATLRRASSPRIAPASIRQPQPVADFVFDELIHLDNRTLAAVLSEVDSNILVLALAGSTDALVDRVCRQMSTRTARSFRRLLRKLGPTRLSDVEAAQRALAQVAARRVAFGQTKSTAS
jgi:flagellar motor switch protein FliG